MFAAVNGTRLFYTDTNGDIPLIGVHGGMGIDGGTLRVPSILALADHGVRVIVPDQRGHGHSSADEPKRLTHATWIEDLRALADALSLQQFALLGHSYGGFLALEFASRWPERLTHLVLVGTSAGPRKVPAASVNGDAELSAHFRERWPHFFTRPEKHWGLFDELQFAADAYNAAYLRELPMYDVRDHIPGITVPTLLLVGRDDWYLPEMEWLGQHLPSASLSVVPDAGHFVFLDQPGEFTRIVAEFLAAPSQPSPMGRFS